MVSTDKKSRTARIAPALSMLFLGIACSNVLGLNNLPVSDCDAAICAGNAGSRSVSATAGDEAAAGAATSGSGPVMIGAAGAAGMYEEGGAGAGVSGEGGGSGAGDSGEGGQSGAPPAFCEQTRCPQACSETKADCVDVKSCSDLDSRCGSNASCCNSPRLPGGSYSRGCDDYCESSCANVFPPGTVDFPATVSAFSLDAFEVTVGRFRQFVTSYDRGDGGSKPQLGAGKNSNDPDDEGWLASWDSQLPAPGALATFLVSDSCFGKTWTSTQHDLVSDNELKPINCVNWFLAYAFCAWDGGRLPSEAEWNYAAGGGDERRVYPWSQSSLPSDVIDSSYAAYNLDAPIDVGSKTAGVSKWNQFDLAGNVSEWMRDSYAPSGCYDSSTRCVDCSYTSADDMIKVVRGGSYLDDESGLLVASRWSADATAAAPVYGFRCARD